jgi:tetratricopeptide (TPR) repeat protein
MFFKPISYLILISSVLCLSNPTRAQNDSEYFIEEDLNYKYHLPGSAYARSDAKKLNPAASFALYSFLPLTYFMIIAEKVGLNSDFDSQRLATFTQNFTRQSVSKVEFSGQTDHTLNGIKGIRYFSDATIKGVELSFVQWITVHNGYSYQLVTWGTTKGKEEVKRQAEFLFSRFEMLDPDKICQHPLAKAYQNFNSNNFGYAINFDKSEWQEWSELATALPGAETGAVSPDDKSAFAVIPIVLEKPVLFDALVTGLLGTMSIDANDSRLKRFPIEKKADLESQIFHLRRTVDAAEYDYAFKIITRKNRAFFVAAWTSILDGEINRLEKQVFSSFTLNDQYKKGPIQELVKKQDHHVYALIYNDIGLYYYKAKLFAPSIDFFIKALSLSSTDETLFINTIDAYAQQQRYQEALSLFDKHQAQFGQSKKVMTWQAWLLHKNGQTSSAIEVYQKIFADNYRSDSDFMNYVDLLLVEKRFDQINQAFEKYLKVNESFELRLSQVQALQQQGKYQEALKVLERQQASRSFNPQISYSMVISLHGLKRHKEALDICNQLIDKGFSSADAFYCKGQSEYYLGWYKKSKESFEKALSYAPQDSGIKKVIQNVSALLGQGDNSSIKTPIDPVKLPAELEKQITQKGPSPATKYNTDKYSAYFIYSIENIEFQKGISQKHTLYRKIKINNQTGVSQFSTLTYPFDPLSQNVFVNKLIVRDKNGQHLSRGNQDDYYIVDQPGTVASFDKELSLPVPKLAPGCTIELVITFQEKNVDKFTFETHSLATIRPVLLSALSYTGDTSHIVYAGSNTPKPIKTKSGLIWLNKNTPVFKWEPLQVHHQHSLPFVHIADSSNDWSKLGVEYLTSIKDKLEADSTTEALAKELTKDAKTRQEKIKILSEHVQKSITYKAIAFGLRARIPNPSKKTLELSYGDCKDHAVLLYKLLQAVSIPSRLALVNNLDLIEQSTPSLDQLNHMIVYLPEEKMFIDATNKSLDLGLATPPEMANKWSFILDTKRSHLLRIPAYLPDQYRVDIQRKVIIDDKLQTQVEEEVLLAGYAASFMRSLVTTLEKNQYDAWAQELLSRHLKTARLNSVKFDDLQDNTKPLRVFVSYTLQKKKAVEKVETGGLWEAVYLATPFVPDRKAKFQVNYPMQITSKVKVAAPAGFRLGQPAARPKVTKNSFARWKTTFSASKSGHQAELNMTFSASTGTFKATLYDQYRSTLEDAILSVSPSLELLKL